MSHRLRPESAAQVIHFPDTLDAFHVVRMRPHLARLLNRHPRRLVLDLAQTRQVKLAGLGMLVDRLRRLGNGSSEIQFLNASPQVSRTLARAGVNGFAAS